MQPLNKELPRKKWICFIWSKKKMWQQITNNIIN